MSIKNLLTVRKKKSLFAIFFCICIIFTSFVSVPNTVYASSEVISLADYTTWEQVANTYGANVSSWLKGIADSLGMSCSAFCSAVATGSVALSPYIVATVAVGATAYLGYDIYTNYDTISDQLLTELVGGSAYADDWFEKYATGILDGTYDLSNGIEVPIDIWNSMTLALSNILTVDVSESFSKTQTCTNTGTTSISTSQVLSWLQSLGYVGTSIPNYTAYNPVICMYNADLQNYYLFYASAYYNAEYSDILLTEVDGFLYTQIQSNQMVNDIGYALRPTASSGVGWLSYLAGSVGTQGIVPFFNVSNLSIANGTISYILNGTEYKVSILCPNTSSVVLSNVTYDSLEFPSTYSPNSYSMWQVLPVGMSVSGLVVSDMSTLDNDINARENTNIPSDYVNGIDSAIVSGNDIPISLPSGSIADYVNDDTITDTSAITDSLVEDTPITDNDTDTSGILSGISSLIDRIIEFLQSILDAILSIPGLIIDGIASLLEALFVPSAECVDEMQELLDTKMPFISDIRSWIDELMKIMQSPEEYASNLSFTVDMGKAENTYWNYGSSKSNAFSATWYLKYKDTVDDIIVGIAWLIFLWNVHNQLPSIISAISTTSFASANLEYQKYSVSTRTKRMKDAKERTGDD